MKLKNKILFILLFFAIILIFNNSSASAITREELEEKLDYQFFAYPNFTYILDNIANYEYYAWVHFPNAVANNSYYLFLSNSDGVLSRNYTNSNFTWLDSENNRQSFTRLYFTLGENNGLPCYTLSSFYIDVTFVSLPQDNMPLENALYIGNVSMYDYDSNELLFQAPPQVLSLEEVVQESHLAAKEITQETLKAELVELVPVGIAIMAAMILVSLIAYFQFWKV